MDGFLSNLVTWEGTTFVVSMFLGMIFAFVYDCIRIIRRVFPHGNVIITSFEDILYWMVISIAAFGATYRYSNGIIRGFMVGAMVLGAVLFNASLGKLYVRYITALLKLMICPLKKILKKIKMGITSIKRKRYDEAGNKRRKKEKSSKT